MEVLGYVLLLLLLAFLAGAGAGIGASGHHSGAVASTRWRRRAAARPAAQEEPAGIGHERVVP